jgi:TolB protein
MTLSRLSVAVIGGTLAAMPPTASTQAIHPQWSPDGSAIAYYQRTGDSAVVIVTRLLDPAVYRGLTSGPGYAANPTWSPDGSRLAFAYAPDGMRGVWDVFVLEAGFRGSDVGPPEPRPVTSTPEREAHTSWSPGGEWIAFVRLTESGTDVYAVRSDGSEVRQLTFTPERDFHPKWSPDGQAIAFDSGGEDRRDIYVLHVESKNFRRVTDMPLDTFASTPAWSPDGSRLAFSLRHDSDADLYLINVDGSGLTRLTDLGGHAGAPYWSPDGTRIAFHSDHEGEWAIYVMAVEGGDGEQPIKISR